MTEYVELNFVLNAVYGPKRNSKFEQYELRLDEMRKSKVEVINS